MNGVSASDTAIDWAGYLIPGERILWQGRPGTGLSFNSEALKKSAFGVFFFGFAIFWTWGAFHASSKSLEPVANFFPLFGIPFLAVGFYLVFGQYFWSAYVRRNSWYSLSSQRAFIATRLLGMRSLKSYPITPGTPIEIQLDDRASIWFAEKQSFNRNSTTVQKIGFELIPDGTTVYALMHKIQAGAA